MITRRASQLRGTSLFPNSKESLTLSNSLKLSPPDPVEGGEHNNILQGSQHIPLLEENYIMPLNMVGQSLIGDRGMLLCNMDMLISCLRPLPQLHCILTVVKCDGVTIEG